MEKSKYTNGKEWWNLSLLYKLGKTQVIQLDSGIDLGSQTKLWTTPIMLLACKWNWWFYSKKIPGISWKHLDDLLTRSWENPKNHLGWIQLHPRPLKSVNFHFYQETHPVWKGSIEYTLNPPQEAFLRLLKISSENYPLALALISPQFSCKALWIYLQ